MHTSLKLRRWPKHNTLLSSLNFLVPLCSPSLYCHSQATRIFLSGFNFLIEWINLFHLEANYFTILWLFLLCINMNQPGVYTCPPSWTHLPPPSPSHPSGLSQSTGFGCPDSCIEPGLATYFTYDNTHVSMLFSQIIPPSLSPTEYKSLFFTSVSLLLSHI